MHLANSDCVEKEMKNILGVNARHARQIIKELDVAGARFVTSVPPQVSWVLKVRRCTLVAGLSQHAQYLCINSGTYHSFGWRYQVIKEQVA